MKAKTSPRDLEFLSAYLDNELDTTRRARLETRLRAEPELRVAYEELRRTRTLLRSLPRLKAPRNFTLSPQMVGHKPVREPAPTRMFPIFQFASALASLLLVVVLLGDFLGIGAAPAAQSEPVMGMMESLESTEVDRKAADSLLSTQPAEGMQEMQREEAPAAEAEEQGETLSLPAPNLTPGITTTTPLSQTVPGEPMITLPASEEMEEAGDFSVAQAGRGQQDRSLWRIAEISLGLAALAFGLVAFYLRKTRESAR